MSKKFKQSAKLLNSALYGLLIVFVVLLLLWPWLARLSSGESTLKRFSLALPEISQLPPILAIRDFISPPPVLPWLATSGNQFVNEKGEPVILRGVNVSSIHWGLEKWNPKATEYAVKSWKAQVIRTRVYQDDYLKNSDAFFAKMEKEIIGPARRSGAYVILHPWIGKNDPLPDQGTIAMWQGIAGHYQDDPNILYDVLAEPHDVTRQQVRDGYIRIIEAVRQVHPRSLIFVSGLGWGREINSYLKDPLPYPNLVYRSNPYNRAGEFESLFGKIAQVYPVFLGEFGADGYPPMTRESVNALLEYADQLGLGWTAWNFSDRGCPCLLGDQNRFTPSPYGQIIKKALFVHAGTSPASISTPPLVAPQVLGRFEIFTDGLQNGFVDLSWETATDLLSQEEVYRGENSLQVTFQSGYAGFFLHGFNLVPTKNFSHLEFYLNFEENSPFPLQLNLNDSQGEQLTAVSLQEYLTPVEPDWMKATVPLLPLNAQNIEISGMIIQNMSGTNQQPIYFDEIKLVK